MKKILVAVAALALTGCAVYTTPYPAPVVYPAGVHTWPPTIYQDPWPVRVPVYPPVVVQPQIVVPQQSR